MLVACLAGCATPSPLPVQATWYLQKDAEKDADARLFIAVLNSGIETLNIRSLALNGRTMQLVDDALPPGGLLVRRFNTPELRWPACMLPVHVTLFLADGRQMDLRPIGQMPSALPQEWEHCPSRAGPPSR